MPKPSAFSTIIRRFSGSSRRQEPPQTQFQKAPPRARKISLATPIRKSGERPRRRPLRGRQTSKLRRRRNNNARTGKLGRYEASRNNSNLPLAANAGGLSPASAAFSVLSARPGASTRQKTAAAPGLSRYGRGARSVRRVYAIGPIDLSAPAAVQGDSLPQPPTAWGCCLHGRRGAIR